MRKSSLGRRSSTQIPVRLSSAGGSSGQKLCSGGRKRSGSLIRPPGFTQNKATRSGSEDRESISSGRSTLMRSYTLGAIPGSGLGAMTPITPRQSMHLNLPGVGSARPSRSETMSTDSNRRMSSFGGTKNSRKDPRPISEKPFQQSAQTKVQQYFDQYGGDVNTPGQSIRPMTTNQFVNMIDHLLKYFDSRHVVTKSNYLEELPVILRKMGYRSKLDRSWLKTVNTPHSWQHVIALLSWLVEAIECMECINPFSIMYSELEDTNVMEGDDMPIDAKVIDHLKTAFGIHMRDPNAYNEIEQLEDIFIEKKIIEENCTDEDFEILKKNIELIEEEIQVFEEKRFSKLQQKEELEKQYNMLLNDCETTENFIEESNNFVASTQDKITNMDQEAAGERAILQKKNEELMKVREKVKGQSITLEEKEKLTSERHELLRMIQFHENSIRGYEKSAFTVDLKLAEGVRKLDALLVEYKRIVTENTVLDPRLKNVDLSMDAFQFNEGLLETVDKNLNKLKEEYKHSINDLASKKEESEHFMLRINQDIKETEEEIAKEKTFLEGLESDLEQYKEQVEKKSQKLKEEAVRCQKQAKEIMDEMAQFDPSKLEEKKSELKKMVHDLSLLKVKIEKYFSGMRANFKEAKELLESKFEKLEQEKFKLAKARGLTSK